MSGGELELLSRAHQLFAGSAATANVDAGTPPFGGLFEPSAARNAFAGHGHYQRALDGSRRVLLSAARTDAAAGAVIAQAQQDHARARELTSRVLNEARADVAVGPQTAMARLEAIRRSVARLRAQRAHVLAARRRARRHRAALRALRYRMSHHGRNGLTGLPFPPFPAANGRAAIAVRAALSRLGRPYVWGATGPDQFDCSGLVQWSYAQAGVHVGRTTYDQIHYGIPVSPSQVRPGDLVFPHAGHVQMAIGNNLVVEAPHAGATVRISPLGANVGIRRLL